MADDKQPRRVKVTDESATHRVGTKRAAIKPHKRATEPNYKQLITDYLGSLRQGSVSQTYWGNTMANNAALLRQSFGLAADDEPYLLLDPTASGKVGLLLSSTGLHLADGRGGTAATPWKDLTGLAIGVQRGTLIIGKNGVTTNDAQVIAALLQKIQKELASLK